MAVGLFDSEAGELDALLSEADPHWYAGFWVDHEPLRVNVYSTVPDPVDLWSAAARFESLGGRVVVRPASVSLKSLIAEQERVASAFPEGPPFTIGLNVRENRVEVNTTNAKWQSLARSGRAPALSSRAYITGKDLVVQPAVSIYGGLALSQCTAGFGVKTIPGTTKGIITAGHCGNSISYQGTNLPFQTENFSGSHDEQWHTAPGLTVTNQVRWGNGTGTQRITGIVPRSSQALGSSVCKYGKITFYDCGTLTDKSYLCGTPNPQATCMKLESAVDLADSGDSGGPVYAFTGGTTPYKAFGIIHACLRLSSEPDCTGGNHDMVYIAIDIATAGLHILTLTQ